MHFNWVSPAYPSLTRWFLLSKQGKLRKRPFKVTPVSISDLIIDSAHRDDCTIAELYRRWKEEYIPYPDVLEILDVYVKNGHGDKIARQWFKPSYFWYVCAKDKKRENESTYVCVRAN